MFKRKKFNVNERLSIMKSFAFVSFKLSSRAVFICCGIDLALIQKYQSQNCMEAWKNIYNSDFFFFISNLFFFFFCISEKKARYKPRITRYNSQFRFYISLYVHISQLWGGKSLKNYKIKSHNYLYYNFFLILWWYQFWFLVDFNVTYVYNIIGKSDCGDISAHICFFVTLSKWSVQRV